MTNGPDTLCGGGSLCWKSCRCTPTERPCTSRHCRRWEVAAGTTVPFRGGSLRHEWAAVVCMPFRGGSRSFRGGSVPQVQWALKVSHRAP